MKFNFKSRKGFTLIELLVVIGILAVLAAIAIPSVAGLIDRANVSADKTNSNEMTNALERFTSEYELYCQDIASGALDPNNLDSAQGRVKNVIGATTRSGIEGIEFAQNATVADNVIAIYRDTKYPMNAYTMKKVVENYTKTSSSTFEPKQSDMHFWYSPDCGVVVVAEPDKTATELDKYVVSGMDAKGNDITSDSVNAQWIDLTEHHTVSNNPILNHSGTLPNGAFLFTNILYENSQNPIFPLTDYMEGSHFPSLTHEDMYVYNGYHYFYNNDEGYFICSKFDDTWKNLLIEMFPANTNLANEPTFDEIPEQDRYVLKSISGINVIVE